MSSAPRYLVLSLILFAFPVFGQFAPNRYTVILEDPPVAARFSGRAIRTAPAAAYRRQIESRQAAAVQEFRARNIRVTGSESDLVNVLFVTVTPDRLAELQSIPGVAGVRPMRRFKRSVNRAVQLANATAAWNVVGGPANAGAGIKIGILDTGIDQAHPAFQDSALSIPAGFPKCTEGHPEDCAFTNNKVIVARSYLRQLAGFTSKDPANSPSDTSVPPDPATSLPDDYSPRDRIGHGTAVASVAAAVPNTGTVTFNGMAPKAWLGSYKIFGSPGVNEGPTDDVLIKAIHDALLDGMDVVNISVGGFALTAALDTGAACGLAAGAPCDPVAAAFEAAVKAGMVIVASAGNDGGFGFDTISSPASAPSVIGVGATTNSHLLTPSVSVTSTGAPAALKSIEAQPTDTFPYPSEFGANSGPLVDVATLNNDGLACTALPDGSLNNSYALIQRGTCSFLDKATNAQLAGALGIIFYMADASPTITPSGLACSSGACFIGPAVMISNADGLALKSYIAANPGAMVTIDQAGRETETDKYVADYGLSPAGANQLAFYSSAGPTPDGAVKPDLVTVGGFDVDVALSYGMYVATQRFDATLDSGFTTLYSPNGYAAADGTSFSSPIVAGAAALVKQAHPTYTPSQIKSALVNSAAQDVNADTFGDPVDVQSLGAGRLDAGAAIASTIAADPATISFGFLKSGGLPVTKTITITNAGTASVTLAAAVSPNSTVAGVTVALDKSSITLAGGASTTLTATLSGTVPAPGAYSGGVSLQATGISLRLPYMFLVGDGNPFFTGISAFPGPFIQGTPGSDGGNVIAVTVDQFGVPVVGSPVTFSVSPRGSVTLHSVPGQPACSPDSSTISITCNSDNYGVAHAGVMLGTRTGSPSINALGSSTTAFVLLAPSVAADGVVNAASLKGSVVAGSYAAINGSNLVDPDLLTSADGDRATFTVLPLNLDYVTVSFDVPSAGISLPGRMLYANSGQLIVQVPWGLQGQSSAQVKVIVDQAFGKPLYSNVVTVPIAPYAPAVYAPVSDYPPFDTTAKAAVSASAPAHAGDVVQIFANGLGPVNNQPDDGNPARDGASLSETTTPVTVTVGGKSATVQSSSLAPGSAGLYQVTVTLPADLAAGDQAVVVSVGGISSTPVNIPVK